MAWYDVMGRLNHMFGLGADLADLAQRSQVVVETMSDRLSELQRQRPQAPIDDFMAEVNKGFTEQVFAPLSDVWERELAICLRMRSRRGVGGFARHGKPRTEKIRCFHFNVTPLTRQDARPGAALGSR